MRFRLELLNNSPGVGALVHGATFGEGSSVYFFELSLEAQELVPTKHIEGADVSWHFRD